MTTIPYSVTSQLSAPKLATVITSGDKVAETKLETSKAPLQNTLIISACVIVVSSNTCGSSNLEFSIIGTRTLLSALH